MAYDLTPDRLFGFVLSSFSFPFLNKRPDSFDDNADAESDDHRQPEGYQAEFKRSQ
jgi:hypothetical protein